MSCASGRLIPFSTDSSTMMLPFSVFFLNSTPSDCSREAICLREPTLNSSTLSFRRLPVFSDHRSWTIGGKTSCSSMVISSIRWRISANSSEHRRWLSMKPLLSCCAMYIATLCSSSSGCLGLSHCLNCVSRKPCN